MKINYLAFNSLTFQTHRKKKMIDLIKSLYGYRQTILLVDQTKIIKKCNKEV